jgi:hypothetical protein
LVHSIGVEQTVTLTEAAVTANRIALDWSHNGQPGHLIAKSPNGIHFSGRYGYGQQTAGFECELTLYKSSHEDLLYGTWRQPDTGQVGTLILRLPRAVESRLSEIARTGDVRESAEGERAAHSVSATASSPAEDADAPPARRNVSTAAEGKVAPLRLAPGTSAKLPVPRPSKVVPKAALRSTEPERLAPKEPARAPTEPAAAPISAPPQQPAPALPPSSATVDHLLSVTSEQFAERDRAELEKELLAAPVSALFKVAHNALAPEMRGIAAQMFSDRYGDLPPGTPPKPAARPAETPESKALKRRSSRHKTNR